MIDDQLWESRIFESPECQHSILEWFFVANTDIIFTIGHCNQIFVDGVDINASDLSTLCDSTFELEKMSN